MGTSLRIKQLMENKGVSAYTVSNDTGISQSTLSRLINKDTKPNASNLKALADYFGVEQSWILTGNNQVNEPGPIYTPIKKEITGYYYPSVYAAAGLDKEMSNDSLDKVPVTLPNWDKEIDFINVYGDSMYPKFRSGDIIGIKEVDLQYINYGYAYVVILKDGQVLLKYVRKGVDKEHVILESENKFYDPKEYHLSKISKVFIIKGIISKTTM